MKLTIEDRLHLEAAKGWLGLGNHLEANEELELITPTVRSHPKVLDVRYRIYAKACRWDMALEIARHVSDLLPDNSWGPFHTAIALHHLKQTQAACDTLSKVVDRHPKEWLIRYNLACYHCALGNLNDAMTWLEKAIDTAGNKDIRQMALDDPALEPLWNNIGDI